MALIPGIGVPELLIVLVVVLLLFGPKRLPQLGKSLGKTVKAIRDGVEGKGDQGEDEPAATKTKKQDVDDSEETPESPPKKDG